MASRAGRPQKADQNLSKKIILQTALPLVRQGGAEAVSFRALAKRLDVSPMAVAYHIGDKQRLLADLAELAFDSTLDGIEEKTPKDRARLILSAYCARVIKNAPLLRAILNDTSLIGTQLELITEALHLCTRELDTRNDGKTLLYLLIDYTHGFALSAASGERNPLTIDDFMPGIDWILSRADISTPDVTA